MHFIPEFKISSGMEAAKNYQREKKVFPDFNDIGPHIFILAKAIKLIGLALGPSAKV